ncbi:MAG: DNA repair protein RecO [Eggerthellaceae bacterium]|nr:DNA repair protein RecO [Eggerthellaceae bacterium]
MSAGPNYHATVLVLKKTKLGEADLILTMLAGDGSLIKAVAKSARKPTSSFATRLDLFCESEVMLVRGRNLDIAREPQLLNSHDAVRANVAATYAAAPILDCLAQVALPELPVEHLYAMATSALAHFDGVVEEYMPAITAAFLIKLFALLGVRPVLDRCISCGKALDETIQASKGSDVLVAFSFLDGGYVCGACRNTLDCVQIEAESLRWAQVLLGATFDEILAMKVPVEASFAVLHFCNRWLRETQNINSKALNQLLTCGLF